MESKRLMPLYDRLKPFLTRHDDSFLVVDTVLQKLHLCRQTSIVETFDASSAALGLGNREGSNKTPTGIHRIREKIGDGAPEGRIFRDRRDTGVDWHPEMTGDNLILTRILRLEGLEEGLNKGAGVDTFERFIYIHGTNRESAVGTPISHGCICLRNYDIRRLFDLVNEGTVVYIDAACITINGFNCSHLHFTGIFGSGMSAIAQYLRWSGIMVSGSDRQLASADTASMREHLSSMECSLFEQNGSGITASTDALCVSTAIEPSNPDIAVALSRGIPIFHRSDVLASIVASGTTIAIAGTSGKSTVTAMVFEFLAANGKQPSLISGAPLLRLERQGLIGNAFKGNSDLLVIEADESDGTIVKYKPSVSVILNISKDHKSIEEILSLFKTLAAQSAWTTVNADDPGLAAITAQERFGSLPSATWRPERTECTANGVIVSRNGRAYSLPLPGSHNAQNLCAALCVCDHLGCDSAVLAAAAEEFQGVARRFSVTRTSSGVIVVDDFAHNPAKIVAAVTAARTLSQRIIAVYQPHGFGPTAFLKDDYSEAFKSVFKKNDVLHLLPIYYAGGTAQRTIASQDLIDGMGSVSFKASAVDNRDDLQKKLKNEVLPGDCILLMGARDPSLPGLTASIAAQFEPQS
jgi:UDP-N-acetylmuramate--alanine ligase